LPLNSQPGIEKKLKEMLENGVDVDGKGHICNGLEFFHSVMRLATSHDYPEAYTGKDDEKVVNYLLNKYKISCNPNTWGKFRSGTLGVRKMKKGLDKPVEVEPVVNKVVVHPEDMNQHLMPSYVSDRLADLRRQIEIGSVLPGTWQVWRVGEWRLIYDPRLFTISVDKTVLEVKDVVKKK
jgi:hypothetical protein